MGRPVRWIPGRSDGGDQRLDRIRPQARRPGHCRLRGPSRHARPPGHHRSRRRRGDRERSRPSQRRNRGRDVFVQARARGHPYERRKPLKRNCRAGGGAAAHRALAQRPGRRRLPPLGARRDRCGHLADRVIAAGARRPRPRDRRNGHAGLHPSAIGAAGHLRPSSPGLCRDAGARRGAVQGRAQAPQRMSARRGGACRHVVPDRPRHDRKGPRLRPADRQFARQRRRPRLCARGAERGGDRGDPSLALRRGDRALDDAAIRLRPALRRLHDRLVDHAAEAQSRRGRARARQDRPDRRRARRALDA